MPVPLDPQRNSYSLGQKFDAILSQFENAIDRGEHPKIETWLEQVSINEQPLLLAELLYIECVYRFTLDEPVHIVDYVHRFPGHVALIEDTIEKAFHTSLEASILGLGGKGAEESALPPSTVGQRRRPKESSPATLNRRATTMTNWMHRQPLQFAMLALGVLAVLAIGSYGFRTVPKQVVQPVPLKSDDRPSNGTRPDLKPVDDTLQGQSPATDDMGSRGVDRVSPQNRTDFLTNNKTAPNAPIQREQIQSQKWKGLMLDNRLNPSEGAPHLLQVAEQTENNFSKILFLSVPLVLHGADKPSWHEEATAAAQGAIDTLKKLDSHDSANPVENIVLLMEKNNIEPARIAEFQKQSEYLLHFVNGGPTKDTFQRNLDSLTSNDESNAHATDRFSEELQTSPTQFTARFALGLACLQRGDAALAEAHFSACESRLAKHDKKMAQRSAAILLVSDPLATSSPSLPMPWIYLLRGIARTQLIDGEKSIYFHGAEADFDTAEKQIEGENSCLPLYVLRSSRGFARMRAKDFTGSIQELEKAIVMEHEFPELGREPMAHFNLAMAHLQQVESETRNNSAMIDSQLKQASKALDVAIQRAPTTRKILAQKATFFFLANNHGDNTTIGLDDAIAALTLATQQHPGAADDTAEEHVALAELLLKSHLRTAKAHGSDSASPTVLHKSIGQLNLAMDAINANRIRCANARVQAHLLSASAHMLAAQGEKHLLAEGANRTNDSAATDQIRGNLQRVVDDATQVILLPSAELDRRQAYGLRGRAAEGLGDYRTAWMDFGEVLKRLPDNQASGNNHSPNTENQKEWHKWLTRRGWVALNPVIADWSEARHCFEKILAEDPADPLALAGRACAQLRLQNYRAAKDSIDQAVAALTSSSLKSSPRAAEILRRAYHIKADIYANLSTLEETLVAREELQTQALSALRKAFDATKLDRSSSAAQAKELKYYWQHKVEVDPDLQPLYALRGFQDLRQLYFVPSHP